MRRTRKGGFTLIELLVVVAIIAIIATIAVIAYRAAIDRARQKRSMADIRLIATAWEARAADTRSYLVAGFTFPTAVTYEELHGSLAPTYLRNIPRYDGWGRPFTFGAGPTATEYGIRSAGRDGVYEGGTYSGGTTSSPDCDIVYGGGNFVQYPAVAQGD
ncbi:MAG TPA: prepilin-type N-terminal cleavage/methylation domain-containing protein [Thermoanaerobaculia bacterium]|nr:prepilin-type N-terminal cleavage/methylation domain-containing protein [Thermoanaerobaculia bacterium]